MKIMSKAFRYGEVIPKRYTADGDNMSPPLCWEGEPEDTRSFALIFDECDVKGGIQNHWLVYNIPATSHAMQENMPRAVKIELQELPGSCNGINDLHKCGYEGPSDKDHLHRYNFKLYALDQQMSLPGKTTRNTLKNAMHHHILAEANLMGVYPA